MNKLYRKYSQEQWAIILLFLSGLYLMILFLLSDGLFGETDSVNHYLIARYSFQHPCLLLDHWGKPLFTILCSPFAQFGLGGAVFFNILCALTTAWLIFRMGRFLKYRFALAAIPFALFAPVYMVNILTSLTEILFALVLVAGIYFFLKGKMILSSVIISFLPFARMEGVMFLVIFLAAFLLVKKYRAIPFLFAGFVIFSLAGTFRYHDLLWFFNAMPYSEKGSALYGSGSFWYYLERFHQLLGFPLTILAVIGIIQLVISLFREKKPALTTTRLTEYYLIPASLFGFILAHSFLWWQGMMGVLATSRFMACVLPLCGFLALVGLNRINSFFDRRKYFSSIFTPIIILITIWVPYTLHKIPARPSWSDQVMKETADDIRTEGLDRYPLYYFDPKLAYYLEIDPYDSRGLQKNFPDPDQPDFSLRDSSIVVWDTHFGEFEHRIPLEKLLNNPCFRLLDVNSPAIDKKFHTGQQYMSAVFRKVPPQNPEDQWVTIKSDNMKLASLNRESKAIVRARAKVLYEKDQDPDKITLIMSVLDNQNEVKRCLTINGSYFKSPPGQWFEMCLLTQVSTLIPESGRIKLNVSYQGDHQILVDGLCLDLLSTGKKQVD
ncbi:MAG: DUF2029 domain-containing protein [Bacteroidales bacterium]|nr:DUF2029 domain-containing protein [Bacteroidales bacterium]